MKRTKGIGWMRGMRDEGNVEIDWDRAHKPDVLKVGEGVQGNEGNKKNERE